jgi:hypothetical protein
MQPLSRKLAVTIWGSPTFSQPDYEGSVRNRDPKDKAGLAREEYAEIEFEAAGTSLGSSQAYGEP